MAVQSEAISNFENFLKLSTVKENINPSKLFNNYKENKDIVFALSPKAQEFLTKLPTSANSQIDPNLVVDINKHFSALEARGFSRESPGYKQDAISLYHIAHATTTTLENQVKSMQQLKQPSVGLIDQYQERIDFYKNLRSNLATNCDLKPSHVLMSVIALGEKHSQNSPAPAIAALQGARARQTPQQFFENITHPSAGYSGLNRLEQTVYYLATGATEKLSDLLGKTNVGVHFAQGESNQALEKSNNARYAAAFTDLAAALYTHVKTNQESPVNLAGAWENLRDSDNLSPAIMKDIVGKVRDPDLREALKVEFKDALNQRGLDIENAPNRNGEALIANNEVVRNLPDKNAANQERAAAPPGEKTLNSLAKEKTQKTPQMQMERATSRTGGRGMGD